MSSIQMDGVGVLRIGVLGCARIVGRALIQPLRSVPHLTVHGIASRSLERAQQFASKYAIPHAYGSYEQLLASPDIDVVYIALTNEQHVEWVIRSLQAGKHVLVEKPMCLTMKEYDRIAAEQLRSGLYVLEGVMIQHHPWQSTVKRFVESGEYGELHAVGMNLSVRVEREGMDDYRMYPEQGGGAWYDFGTYWLQTLQAIVGLNMTRVEASSDFDGPNRTDWTFRAEAAYENGLKATFKGSFEEQYEASVVFQFERCNVVLQDIFRPGIAPCKLAIHVECIESGEVESIGFEKQSYFSNQWNYFGDVIMNGITSDAFSQTGERVKVLEQLYNQARMLSTTIVID
ncbi:Gfo/Idh/MocA family protein [Paenibacillus arenosi]|uniref:Gfo/Idh/MocA family oxidoreductase n=1 Tax=Paenibacillus arenosi TaxID=2774142 RepID=A0ABR9ASW1_9BACL|nr:Gfo/Idh/MocA family oxidoreductase [Paenibacillus arenosi]MBD8497199.1 Gfo/Idh/MocA family oxidoreductase [Paenibacillus arenosi]